MHRLRLLSSFVLALASLAGPSAAAAELAGRVEVQSHGQPKADRSDVVIFVADQPFPSGARPLATMAQSGRKFSPALLVVPTGTTVRFPNDDPIEHNVFSRSPHANFDLGRFGKGGSKDRTFDEPGVIDVYCNVHSDMVGHVVVVPGPFAITGPDGRFTLHGLVPGQHTLVIWDRFGAPAVRRQDVEIPTPGGAAIQLEVDEALDREPTHRNKFGGSYRTVPY